MSEEVKNEIVQPDWLNQDFIQNALQEAFKDNSLKVSKFSINLATAPGDNYVSQIFRVNVELSSKTKSKQDFNFLIKSLPKGDKMEDFVHECDLFQKEAKMLSTILPKVYKYLTEAGYPHKWSAEVYYSQGPPRDLIFLEDLRPQGYRVADRRVGLDLEHSTVVLESLAVLHAGTLALIEKEPEIVKQLDEGFWLEPNEKMLRKTLEEGIEGLSEEMEKWTDIPEKYARSMKSLQNSVVEKTFKSFRRRDDRFNVITHGDTWTNNYMFKYDGQKVENLKFVDFQIGGYNSPVLDLIYFIFSSPAGDIRFSKLDYFLETYYNKLREVCKALKLKNFNYTLKDLKDDFDSRIFFGLVVSICVFPFTIVKDDDIMDPNDLLDENTKMDTRMYRTARYVKEMKMALPFFEKKGIL